MASGEEQPTVRPLRPAAPPDGALAKAGPATERTPLPRPRPAVDPPAPTDAPPTDAGAKPANADASAKPPSVDAEADGGAKPANPDAGEKPADADADAKPASADADRTPGANGREGTDTPATDEPSTGDPAAGPTSGQRRVPFARALRLPPVRRAASATRAWSRRPSGRLTLPAVFGFALVAATAVVGAVVVPAAVRTPSPAAVDATAGAALGTPPVDPTAVPGLPGLSGAPVLPGATGLPGLPPATLLPGGVAPTAPVGAPATGRPADALAGWARTTGAKVGIAPVAMQAYGYAELVLAQTNRSCQLSWTTLAAIGYVESRHGQANGATLKPDGRAEPEIIGDPLDGQGGRSRIIDTDRGLFDRDTVYDRAIGPMQFIPTTWQEIGADADNDGRKDPHDLDDAALAAARYLCAGGRNMTIPGDWWGAILSYNDVRPYAQAVFDTANRYGQASRT
ncbi:lytic murein transglycosylase [Micromonospora sp. CPCC 205711]|uniref:lytic murein transglycosylase n=1 Tax=Micromonospora sp. CPCC 205547 TaxID=3122400 RepID=UPI002FF345D8